MAGKQLREQLREAADRDFSGGFEVHQPLFNNVVTDGDYADLVDLSPLMRRASDDEEMGLVTISAALHHNQSTNLEAHCALPEGKPGGACVSSCSFLEESEDDEQTRRAGMPNAMAVKEKAKSTKKKKKTKEKRQGRKSSASTTITGSADFVTSAHGCVRNPAQSVVVDFESNAYLAASCVSSRTASTEAKTSEEKKKKKKKKKASVQ